MKNQGSDIEKFNQEVSHTLAALLSCGASVTDDDLIPQLLKGCKNCSDKEFVRHVKDIQCPLTAHGIMDDTNTFHKACKEGEEWSAPTEEDEKIIALQSMINKLQQQRQKQPSDKSKKSKQSKDKNGKDKKQDNDGNERPAWMLKQPGSNEAHTKEVNGWTCHCCPVHSCWVRRAPSDCILEKQKDKNKNKGQESHDQGKPKLQLAEADE